MNDNALFFNWRGPEIEIIIVYLNEKSSLYYLSGILQNALSCFNLLWGFRITSITKSAKNQYNTHGPYEFTGKGTNKALLQFMSENTSSATPLLMYVKPPIFTFTELYFSTFQHSLFNDS